MSREVYQFHPLCSVFPLQDKGKDWDDFVEDIRKHGVLEPIVVFNNQIIDGRRRYRAATIARAPYKTVEWLGTENDLKLYVWSKNGNRRHLTVRQKAVIFLSLFPNSVPTGRGRVRQNSVATYERARALKEQGMTVYKIAQIFNAEAVPTVRGGPWNKGTVGAMLKRPPYHEPNLKEMAQASGLAATALADARRLQATNPKLAAEVAKGTISFRNAALKSNNTSLRSQVQSSMRGEATRVNASSDEEQRIKWGALLLKNIKSKKKLDWSTVPLNDLVQYMADIKGLKRELDEEQDRVHAEILRRPRDLQEGGQIA